jgi:hypothetical protein
MKRRVALIQKSRKSPAESAELRRLDKISEGLPTEETATDNDAMEIIRRAAKAWSKKPPAK